MALKVKVDTSVGRREAAALRKDLMALGSSAVSNEKEMEKLQKRLSKGLEAKTAKTSLDNLNKSLNLTRLETAKLQSKMGDYSGSIRTLVSGNNGATKSFMSMGSAIGAAVAALGAYKIAGFVKDVALAGARYETLGIVMNNVGKNAGYSADQMEKYSEQVRKAGIQMDTSRETVIKLTQAHIDLENANKLARIAQDAAVIGNVNSSQALERMVYGIQTAQIEVLKSIGLNVNFENSYKKLATQLGKNASDLSESEKTQARLNVVMERGADIAGTYEAAMETAGKQITSLPRYLNDFKINMGLAFNPATADAVSAITDTLKLLNEEIVRPENQEALADISREFADWVVANNDLLKQNLPDYIRAFGESMRGISAIAGAAFSGITLLNDAIINLMVNSKAAGMVSGGQMSLSTFLTSSTNQIKELVLAFDNASGVVTKPINKMTEGWDLYNKKVLKTAGLNNDIAKSLSLTAKELKALQNLNVEKYAIEISLAEQIEKDTWLIREEGLKNAEKQHEESVERQTQLDYDAFVKNEEDKAKEAEKALEKSLKQQEKDYQHMYDNIHDINASMWRDFMDGGDNAFDIILNKAKDVFAEILATWSTQIMMNVLVGSGTSGGGVVTSLLGGSGGSGGGILGEIGKSILGKGLSYVGEKTGITNLFTGSGGLFAPSASFTPAMAESVLSLNTATSGLTMPATATATTGSSMSGLGGLVSAAAPAAFFAAYAAMGAKIIGNMLEDRPVMGIGRTEDPYYNLDNQTWWKESEEFDFRVLAKETGNEGGIKDMLDEYFTGIFKAVDEITNESINDIWNNLPEHFRVSVNASDPAQALGKISGEVFDELIGDVLLDMFPDEGTIKRLVERRTNIYQEEGTWERGVRNLTYGMTTEQSYAQFEDDVSRMTEIFNREFFAAIAPEGGNEWDSLIAFGNIVKDNEDFMTDFNRQIEEFGETAVSAFKNIQTIDTVLEGVESGIEAITKIAQDSDDAIPAMIDTWAELNAAMNEVHATTEQLAKLERGRNIDIGAKLTGITATSLKGVITSGGDIKAMVEATLAKDLAGQLAETLMDETLTAMIEEAGRIRAEEGPEAAEAFLAAFDYSEAQAQVDEFNRSVNGAMDDIVDGADHMRQAIADIFADQKASFDALQESIRQEEILSSGLSWLDSEESSSFSDFVSFIGNATDAMEQLRNMGSGAAGELGQLSKMVGTVIDQLSDQVALGRLLAGDISGALAATKVTGLDPNSFETAGGFNTQYIARVQDNIRDLAAQALSYALDIPNLKTVLWDLLGSTPTQEGQSGLEILKTWPEHLGNVSQYFDQITDKAKALTAAGSDSVSAMDGVIGRLESLAFVMTFSAGASNYGTVEYSQNPEADAIADAATRFMEIIKSTAVESAVDALSFLSDEEIAAIGDSVLLISNVSKGSAETLETALTRISNALILGDIDVSQFEALSDAAIDMFEGISLVVEDTLAQRKTLVSGIVAFNKALDDTYQATGQAVLTMAGLTKELSGFYLLSDAIDGIHTAITSTEDEAVDLIQSIVNFGGAFETLNASYVTGVITSSQYNSVLSELTSSYSTSIGQIKSAKSAYENLTDTIQDTIRTILSGTEDLGGNAFSLFRDFQDAYAKVMAGDASAASDMTSAATGYLSAFAQTTTSQIAYDRQQGLILRSLKAAEKEAGTQVEAIDELLEITKGQVVDISDIANVTNEELSELYQVNDTISTLYEWMINEPGVDDLLSGMSSEFGSLFETYMGAGSTLATLLSSLNFEINQGRNKDIYNSIPGLKEGYDPGKDYTTYNPVITPPEPIPLPSLPYLPVSSPANNIDQLANIALYNSLSGFRPAYDPMKDYSDLPGFANGGIASGPMSGYPVLLHGIERIEPLNSMHDPVKKTNDALIVEVRNLRQEVANLRAGIFQIAKNTKETNDFLDYTTGGEDSIKTRTS